MQPPSIEMTMTLVLLCLASAATAADEALLERRQATFESMKGEVKKLKDALGSAAPDSPAVAEPAARIVDHARSLPDEFVIESWDGDTRAKKKIWKNKPDFDRRMQSLIEHAEQLDAASRAADPDGLKASFKALSKDCRGCHQRYRQLF